MNNTRRLGLIILMAVSVIAASSAIASVDQAIAKKWIGSAYAFAGLDGNALSDPLDSTIDAETTRKAWVALKHCRDAGNSLDLDVAAAEHYLFIRWYAAKEGQLNIVLMPQAYEFIKKLGLA